MECQVDAKPRVDSVKWLRDNRFINTQFKHTIPSVKIDEAGNYICSADNGLGQIGSETLVLDVQYGPQVQLPSSREVKIGENVFVECKVTSNPRPSNVQWYKVGDPDFHYVGDRLHLNSVTALHNGRYICSATNFIHPSGKSRMERVGNATIDIHVRHKPGNAFILPEKPIAVDGGSVTLTCGANPPGYPIPTYNWWKDSQSKILAVGSEFTIDNVNLNSEGKYHCQPSNDHGKGSVGSVHLEVYQSPKIITQLQSSITKKASDHGFQLTCTGVAKPQPKVRWFKDGKEIAQSNVFDIETNSIETLSKMSKTVQSTLHFVGSERINNNQLMPTDRGHYTCQFENEVSRIDSTMLLRIEHSPVVVHQHNKVAFDEGQVGYISCKMQAYPKPRFTWHQQNSILPNDRHSYQIEQVELGDDIYMSTLKIFRIDRSSYGDYTCKAINDIGQQRTKIKLQNKGKPERPVNVRPVDTSYNTITLAWDEGFNGGFNNTSFSVEYRESLKHSAPKYKNCGFRSPCNVTDLHQHTQYTIRIKARNIKGESKYSDPINVVTKVDKKMIPTPENVQYEKTTGTASFRKSQTTLRLVAKVELENHDGSWTHYNAFPVDKEEFAEILVSEPKVRNLRVRLCVEENEIICGRYQEAQLVDVRLDATKSSQASAWLIAIVVGLIVLALLALAIGIKCFCCRRKSKAKVLKNDEVNSNRPTIVHSTQPPPYTTNLDKTEKDVSDDSLKANLYNYHQNGHVHFAINANEQNSANGGSVNSQDSLWNVKANAAAADQYMTYQNGYVPYNDAMAMQIQTNNDQENYTHYPHYPEEYLNERNRQHYNANHRNHRNMESECK